MVQADVARRLLGVLLDNLADLRRYRETLTRSALRGQRDLQHMVLHALYVTIQASVDLALHAAADLALPQATTYQDAFRRLGEAGLLDAALAERLAGWAGLRNVLAHFYPVIDYDRVFDALQELDDLAAFARLMAGRIGP